MNGKTTKYSCKNRQPCIPEARWMHTMTAIPCNHESNSLSSCPFGVKVVCSSTSFLDMSRTKQHYLPVPPFCVFVYVQGTIIYGGCSAQFTPLDDVWLYTSSTGWFPVSPIPSMPRAKPMGGIPKKHAPVGTSDPFFDYISAPARWLHTSTVVPTSNRKYVMLVHGGAANNVVYDDVWIFPASDCLAALKFVVHELCCSCVVSTVV